MSEFYLKVDNDHDLMGMMRMLSMLDDSADDKSDYCSESGNRDNYDYEADDDDNDDDDDDEDAG